MFQIEILGGANCWSKSNMSSWLGRDTFANNKFRSIYSCRSRSLIEKNIILPAVILTELSF